MQPRNSSIFFRSCSSRFCFSFLCKSLRAKQGTYISATCVKLLKLHGCVSSPEKKSGKLQESWANWFLLGDGYILKCQHHLYMAVPVFPSILRTHCLPWVPVSNQCMPSCRISSVTEMTKCWKQMGTPGTVRLPWTNTIFEELFSTICAWRAEHRFCMLFLEKERERGTKQQHHQYHWIILDILWHQWGSVVFCRRVANATNRQGTVRYRAGQTGIRRATTSWATWSTTGLDTQLGTDGGSNLTDVGTQATPGTHATPIASEKDYRSVLRIENSMRILWSCRICRIWMWPSPLFVRFVPQSDICLNKHSVSDSDHFQKLLLHAVA